MTLLPSIKKMHVNLISANENFVGILVYPLYILYVRELHINTQGNEQLKIIVVHYGQCV